ncbi:MAG: hypothetical protein ACFB4J_05675, partial [Elainellaceae cyanobacterium]
MKARVILSLFAAIIGLPVVSLLVLIWSGLNALDSDEASKNKPTSGQLTLTLGQQQLDEGGCVQCDFSYADLSDR